MFGTPCDQRISANQSRLPDMMECTRVVSHLVRAECRYVLFIPTLSVGVIQATVVLAPPLNDIVLYMQDYNLSVEHNVQLSTTFFFFFFINYTHLHDLPYRVNYMINIHINDIRL